MYTQIEPFEARFEDVSMYFHKLEIKPMVEAIRERESKQPATTGVYLFDVRTHHDGQGASVIGDVNVVFRNQGEHFDSLLWANATITISSYVDDSGKSVFNKFIQYLFDWTSKYVTDNRIIDANGNPFVMPPYTFSKDQFNGIDE